MQDFLHQLPSSPHSAFLEWHLSSRGLTCSWHRLGTPGPHWHVLRWSSGSGLRHYSFYLSRCVSPYRFLVVDPHVLCPSSPKIKATPDFLSLSQLISMLFVYMWKFICSNLSLAEPGCLGFFEPSGTTTQPSPETCKDIVTKAFWQELVVSPSLSDSYKLLWGLHYCASHPIGRRGVRR